MDTRQRKHCVDVSQCIWVNMAMRANEILKEDDIPKPIATGATGVWYEITAHQMQRWHKKMRRGEPLLINDPGVRYFMHVKKGDRIYNDYNMAVSLKNNNLASVDTYTSFYSGNMQDLQALADVTGAQSGPHIWGAIILYKGKTYYKTEVLSTLPQVGLFKTYPIYEVPKDAWWILRKLSLEYLVSSDQVVVFNPHAPGATSTWVCASIKNGKITSVKSRIKLTNQLVVEISKELASALGLEQSVSVANYILPKTKLHKTLQAINDHPGVDRGQLYWKVLKLKKLPAQGSNEDAATELAGLGLVDAHQPQDRGVWTYTISTPGSMVLAALNNSTPIKKADLLDEQV